MDQQLRAALEGVTVPLWPEGGQALNMGRTAVFRAAQRGDLPVIKIGKKYVLQGAPFRRLLGLDEPRAAA